MLRENRRGGMMFEKIPFFHVCIFLNHRTIDKEWSRRD
jgi:hypothetical protein